MYQTSRLHIHTGNLGIKGEFYSGFHVGTLVSTKIFVMNQILVHIKYTLLINSLQKIKIK